MMKRTKPTWKWTPVINSWRRIAVASALLALLGANSWAALTFNFDDEYYISSSTVFNSTFAGHTAGSYSSAGIYQWTQDHTTVTRVGSATGASMPGEFVSGTTPNANQELMLTGFGQSLNNGNVVGSVYNLNNPINGTVVYFQYKVGGTTTAFDFNSFDLRGLTTAANLQFTVQGYLGGVLQDTATLNVTGNAFSTYTLNWANVDTVEIVSTAALPVNWGSGTLYMDNVVINGDMAVVPEPSNMFAGALLLLPFGASTLRILQRRAHRMN
jgi:hypothetical protein